MSASGRRRCSIHRWRTAGMSHERPNGLPAAVDQSRSFHSISDERLVLKEAADTAGHGQSGRSVTHPVTVEDQYRRGFDLPTIWLRCQRADRKRT
jgi:citrate lyase beta subunit